MRLDRVTVTGADDSVHPYELIELQQEYPFVEWGILISESREGSARFPSAAWMENLSNTSPGSLLRLSAHICGRWVREIMVGCEPDGIPKQRLFERAQLNFHAQGHDFNIERAAAVLLGMGCGQYILQVDGVNDSLTEARWEDYGLSMAPLFDVSGGAGIEPDKWPAPLDPARYPYQGYAGGLHPEKIHDQMRKIAEAVGPGDQRVWIDIETHVRSDADIQFDMEKVRRFLSEIAPYVRP